jgi:hypothetical protein
VQCNQQLATAGSYISSGCSKVLSSLVAAECEERAPVGVARRAIL